MGGGGWYGSQVTVTITDNAPAQPTKTVTSRAVLQGLTFQYSWDISAPAANGDAAIVAGAVLALGALTALVFAARAGRASSE